MISVSHRLQGHPRSVVNKLEFGFMGFSSHSLKKAQHHFVWALQKGIFRGSIPRKIVNYFTGKNLIIKIRRDIYIVLSYGKKRGTFYTIVCRYFDFAFSDLSSDIMTKSETRTSLRDFQVS